MSKAKDESTEASPPMQDIYYIQGYLYKKAGGKAFDKKTRVLDRWHKRFFVLPPGETAIFAQVQS